MTYICVSVINLILTQYVSWTRPSVNGFSCSKQNKKITCKLYSCNDDAPYTIVVLSQSSRVSGSILNSVWSFPYVHVCLVSEPGPPKIIDNGLMFTRNCPLVWMNWASITSRVHACLTHCVPRIDPRSILIRIKQLLMINEWMNEWILAIRYYRCI